MGSNPAIPTNKYGVKRLGTSPGRFYIGTQKAHYVGAQTLRDLFFVGIGSADDF